MICNGDRATSFAITDTKICIPVMTLSTQDNTKLLQKLKSGFKRTINWNKRQSKVSTQEQNQYLDYLVDPSFQRVSKIFVLEFEDTTVRTGHAEYFSQKWK